MGARKYLAGTILFVSAASLTTALGQQLSDFTQNPDAIAAYQRGVEAGMRGRHEQALTEFQAALELDEDFAEGYRAAGFALESLGRAHEAIEYYEEAIEHAPDFVAPWINLAGALGKTGRAEEGLEAFLRAVEIDPLYADTQSAIRDLLLMLIEASRPIGDSSQPYQLRGFAIMPPVGESWRVQRGQTPTMLMFSRSTAYGGDHTVFAIAETFEALSSSQDPVQFVQQSIELRLSEFRTLRRYSRLRVGEFEKIETELDCRQSAFSVRDRGVAYAPRQSFTMSGWIVGCLHPDASVPLVLVLSSSQRYTKEHQPIDLEEELKAFRHNASATPVDR